MHKKNVPPVDFRQITIINYYDNLGNLITIHNTYRILDTYRLRSSNIK